MRVSPPCALFIGLDLPYEMRRNLELLVAHLRHKADLSWSPTANLHITTKFIGEWPDQRLAELKTALNDVPRPGALPIALRGLGWCSQPALAARVLLRHRGPGGARRACPRHRRGLPAPRHRPREQTVQSSPHAGAHPPAPAPRPCADRPSPELPGTDFGAFSAQQFFLYKSDLGPGGSVYTKLANYPLTQ